MNDEELALSGVIALISGLIKGVNSEPFLPEA